MRAAAQLVPYALLAALSPLAFAATLAVLRAGRLKAVAFAACAVAGQFAACALFVIIGSVALPGTDGKHSTLKIALELAVGSALILLAVRVRRGRLAAEPSGDRSAAMVGRLRRVHAATAAVAGLLLGVGGPKRLVLTMLAAATIAASALSRSSRTAVAGLYAAASTIIVWAPVLLCLLLGARAVARLDDAEAWLVRHRRTVTFYALVSVGALFFLDALAVL
jgi:hypothetical protein